MDGNPIIRKVINQSIIHGTNSCTCNCFRLGISSIGAGVGIDILLIQNMEIFAKATGRFLVFHSRCCV